LNGPIDVRRFCSSVKSHFNEHDEHASKTQLCIDVDGLYAAFLYPRDQVAINLTTISALLSSFRSTLQHDYRWGWL